jgi:hypothetical protein
LSWVCEDYRATRNFDSDVPIDAKAVEIPVDEVVEKKLAVPLAQYCITLELAVPSVLTWIV